MVRDAPQGKAATANDASAKGKVEQGSQTFDKEIVHTGMV